jgi:hypothetical protein
MNTYDINDVLKVGNPLDEGSNFKCIKCNEKGELTFAPTPMNKPMIAYSRFREHT